MTASPAPAWDPLPHTWVRDAFGRNANTWEMRGIHVIATPGEFEIRSDAGELLGLVERDVCGPSLLPVYPLIYRAVIREVPRFGDLPWARPSGPGWIPTDPVEYATEMRRRWDTVPEGDPAF
jgi:hypothetical protein